MWIWDSSLCILLCKSRQFHNLKTRRRGSLTQEDISLFHKVTLEERVYGFDVLEYASHLAASWLTLRTPEVKIKKMNIYTLPLGSKGSKDIWLGSLSIDAGHQKYCVIPKATSLASEEVGPKRAGIMTREKVF